MSISLSNCSDKPSPGAKAFPAKQPSRFSTLQQQQLLQQLQPSQPSAFVRRRGPTRGKLLPRRCGVWPWALRALPPMTLHTGWVCGDVPGGDEQATDGAERVSWCSAPALQLSSLQPIKGHGMVSLTSHPHSKPLVRWRRPRVQTTVRNPLFPLRGSEDGVVG